MPKPAPPAAKALPLAGLGHNGEKQTRRKLSKQLRKHAERLLNATRRKIAKMPMADVQRLVHELQVHQIELKMQNEELRRTQLELEAARERLTLPYDAAPVGFLTLDAVGVIHETNLTTARLLQIPRSQLAEKKLAAFIAPESQQAFQLHRQRVFTNGTTQVCELEMLPPGGRRFEARLETLMERAGRDASDHCLMILTDITERKRAEEALKASEHKYRWLYESITDAFASVTMSGRIQEFNPTFARMLGYTDQELSRLTYEDFTPKQWHAFEAGILQQQVLARGYSEVYEKEYRRKDGTVFPVELRTLLIRDAAGQPTGMWAFVRDITGRKRAEEALRQSEASAQARRAELETLMDAIPAAVLIAQDAACRQMTGNRTAMKLLRIPPGRNPSASAPQAGRPAYQIWSQENRLAPEDLPMQRAAATGQPVTDTESAVVFRDGGKVHLLGSALPLFHESGAVRGCVGAFVDITERKRAEEALRESQQQLKLVLQGANIGLWNWNLQTDKVDYSREWKTQLGYEENEIGDPLDEWLKRLHPDDRAPTLKKHRQFIKRPWPNFENEFRLRHKDGSWRWILSRATLLNDAAGKPARLMGIHVDVTERKHSEEALRRSRDELEQRVQERTAELTAANAALRAEIAERLRAERAEQESRQFAQTVVNSLTAHIAIVDQEGQIVSVNQRWLDFAKANQVSLQAVSVGANYLEACTTGAQMDKEIAAIAAGLRAVLSGRLQNFYHEYPCHSPTQRRWFAMRVTPLLGDSRRQVVVSHEDLTERKRAEEALRKSEERFRAIAAHTPDHIIMQDLNLRYCLVINPQLGLTVGEMIGKSDWDLFKKVDAEYLTAIKTKVLDTGKPCHVERPLPNLKGAVEFFEGDYIPMRDATDKVNGLIGYFRNITERKRAEEALKAREAQLHFFVQQAPAAIAMFDRNMNYLAVSQRWASDFNQGRRDIIGRNHYQVHPDLPKRWKEIHRKAMAGESQSSDEDLWLQADGARVWWRWSVNPWLDAHGNIGGILILAENITRRKEAEDALHKSEARLHAILDNSPAMIFLKDLKGRYLHFNRKLAEVFHLSPEKDVGKRDVDLYPPKQAALCRLSDRKLLEAGVPMDFEEVTIQDDGPHTGIVTKFPLRDAQGKIYAIGGIFTDITERKRIEEERHKFVSLADNSLEFMGMCDLDFKPFYINAAGRHLLGLDDLKVAAPARLEDFFYPEDLPFITKEFVPRLLRDGHGEVEIRFRHFQTGEAIWMFSNLFAIRDTSGTPVGWASVSLNITERKRTEERITQLSRAQAILAGIDHAIVHIPDRQRLLDEVCRIAVEKGGFTLAWIGMAAPDGSVQPVAQAGVIKYVEGLRVVTHDVPTGRGPVGTAIRENRPVVIDNISDHQRMAPWRRRARRFGLRFVAAFPIRISGKVAGAFQFYAPKADSFDEKELRLLTQVSDDISFALTAIADLAARKQAEIALLDSSRFNQQIIADAKEGIIVYDRDLRYLVWNPFMEKLTGLSAAEVIGKRPLDIFPFLSKAGVMKQLNQVLAGKGATTVDFHFQTPQRGHSGWVTDSNAPLRNAKGEIIGVIGIVSDITERKLAEDALRRSEHNLSIFFNQAPIGLVWLSAGGTILRANLAQLDLLGYSPEDYLGQSFIKFCGEPSQGLELLTRLGDKETVRNFPMTRRRKDGSIRHVLVDAISFWNDDQFQYSSIFLRDVTDRIELEKEILQIGERERRSIAQDLHDGLGQLLGGTAYLTGTLQKKLAAKSIPEARDSARILEVINEAIAQTRSLARGLHPVEPEPNGLMAALEMLASRTHTLFHVRCHFNCPQPVLIKDNVVATHLFRIAQEAVTNAIKHGKAGRIRISLAETPERINLAINNNGKAIPARHRKKSGMGLRIMRYRAGIIGGFLALQTEADGGTTVVCTVHLSSSESHPGKK